MTAPQNLLDNGATIFRKAAIWGPYHLGHFLGNAAEIIAGEARFRLNQFQRAASAPPKAMDSGTSIQNIGPLQFFTGLSEHAGRRGGEMPWHYMQGLCDNQITRKDKRAELMGTLAQLPRNVSFTFKATPDMRDPGIVREAFEKAGFTHNIRPTMIYRGKEGEDPIDRLERPMGKYVRSARRELEIVPMTPDEFYDYYKKNLNTKFSHFHLNIERTLMQSAAAGSTPDIKIIAARRKDEPHLVDAALIHSTGSDGYCRLLRLSFRKAAEDDTAKPHQHAAKMLIVEAMTRANNRGLPVDTDGFTEGGRTTFMRYGVFDEVERSVFRRNALGRIPHYWTDRHL